MTTSNIKNATEGVVKSVNDIKIESAAVPSGLSAAESVTRRAEIKIKAPVKTDKKPVVKKVVDAPTPAQVPVNLKARLPTQVKSKLAVKAPAQKLTKTPAFTQTVAKLPPTVKAQQAAKPSLKIMAEKTSKQKKPKLVRDSFTIPKTEYVVLDDLKQRAVRIGIPTKKSELLRAGIKALAAMTDAGFKAALNVVPTIKTGRPAKD